jgi:hypothetical protein
MRLSSVKQSMPLDFLLLEGSWFDRQLKPALTASWRQRSFQPCQALCIELAGAARRFADTYHVSLEGSTLFAVLAGMPYDRNVWRCLVGELVLYGAEELPEIQTAPATLCRLLAPNCSASPTGSREAYASIQQAHFGSRDLMFGARVYHPEQVGVNNEADVRRLTDYLGSVNPDAWTTADLLAFAELVDEEERTAELEFVRDWLPALRQMYERACKRNQVIVCECQ